MLSRHICFMKVCGNELWGTSLDKAVRLSGLSKQAEAAAPGPNTCSWSPDDTDGSCV